MTAKQIVIIGGGPSGLIAAEILAGAGHRVSIYDRMPSVGRKLQMAGRGGLNLTHSEPLTKFMTRYGAVAADWLAASIHGFSPDDLRAWCEGLGEPSFTGSSGRVFPRSMKAAPLLRAWLVRLSQLGVQLMLRHTWQGFEDGELRFTNALGDPVLVQADAVLLALGGASWPRLGADGSWVEILAACGVEVAALKPANCGFMVKWSDHFAERFAGQPLKPVALQYGDHVQQGEIMITKHGIEGGAVYALSAALRDGIAEQGSVTLHLDLRPAMTHNALAKKLEGKRGNLSFSNYLRKAGFPPLAAGLLREIMPVDALHHADAATLAGLLKALPVTLTAPTGMGRAISTAGGITRAAMQDDFMLRNIPGVFAAGEMLDWEAPTGGYLLQACFSTGVAAANGMLRFLA